MMKLKLQAAGIPLLALSFAVISCKSTDGSIEDNNTNPSAFNVRVNLSGVENIEETPVLQASAGKSNSVSPSPQQTKISLGDDSFIMATLTPQSNTASVASQAQASINPMAAATPPTELGTGIRYKVAVYDASGNYVTEKEFVYKNGETDGFQLNGGQNYTFVAYSVNSASSTPSINNGGTLAAAKLSGISGDLMYFKKNMTVSGNGVNNLDVVLKHQYSQITTKLDARQVGNISAVSNPVITPANSSADISFATNAITYNGPLSTGQTVSFSNLNQPVLTSSATQVIANTTTTGQLNLGNVTIDGVTKPAKIDNLKITPGVQYNLNLRFGPCRQDILPEKFDVANGVSKTFTMPATDFGFTFDIYKLDNSFNLTINGTKMSTAEINFEDGYGVNGRSTSSIRFQDKTKYGSNGIPTIYSMEGVPGKPLIRVVISKDGQVSLFGSKSSGGPLEPMELYNGSTFNKIKWNTTGSNTVTATQMVFGTTYMSGFGTGKQIVTCTP
ncbi:hypothetical protein MC916_002793 [Elizabethkingia anophelis]|uniref:hypothetical protein n=1 Tax=Elizabethkingia anophelis TaxID=1117645 RepID=UPI001D66B4B5|nr:hypothetical protein [Elizabethkingia anophelis]EHM8032975.1 hypothetical protein [Elizabethkingia anophelis]EHZ9535583.1 hypothetical protein [Elizabethkingia anophelis]EKU3673493.1 hypothetical protein [Elizabethkingia anophelis]EKU4210471.1 hypothetical protein [Elizabethkingia anophelis]